MTWDSHALLSRLNTATADQEAPFAVLDLGALRPTDATSPGAQGAALSALRANRCGSGGQSTTS